MVFGIPELTEHFPSFRLDRRGLLIAKLKGDIDLAAAVAVPTPPRRSASARVVSSPRIPLEACEKDLPAKRSTVVDQVTTPRPKLTSAQMRRLMQSVVPPPPVARPSPPPSKDKRELPPSPRDIALATKFHDQELARRTSLRQQLDQKHYPVLKVKKLASDMAIQDNVNRLHYAPLDHIKLVRRKLAEQYLQRRRGV
jgi:hypothetical protein